LEKRSAGDQSATFCYIPAVREAGESLGADVSDLQGAVFLVTGIPAAGKSTVAEGLARRFARSVHVRGDEFRRMVVSGRVAMSPNPSPEAWAQLRLRYRLAAMTADAWHDAGFTVVMQDVIVGPVLAEQVTAIASRPLYLVVLAPDPAAVASREAARPKTGYNDGWSIGEFDAGFRATTPRIGLWIDSSMQSSDETVDEILRRARTEAAV